MPQNHTKTLSRSRELNEVPAQGWMACPFCGTDPRHLEYKSGFYTERLICDPCGYYLAPDVWQRRVTLLTTQE